MRELEITTPRGTARVRITDPAAAPGALLVLGHGAGGDVDAPDLTAVHDAAVAAGVSVALVTQPYRVAGRRAPAPATHLDEAWTAVVTALSSPLPPTASSLPSTASSLPSAASPLPLTASPLPLTASSLPLIVGGRSSGARVACRTASAVGAAGVLALAFPLHPPGKPEKSRAGELSPTLPTLVVNGDRDPFGVPVASGNVSVVVRPGAVHDLRKDLPGTAAAVVDWLRRNAWAH
ncbi:alpha/beta hydrolase family protein [Actinoplanes sp. RD1]|uniref:alpha/beta hydrolase family protein n=1 Tax=Actinoplanes sp. RD1 TaxID=3064538 RepID=UPI002740E835|nr:alpha/beta family hydrolase [Actinoplanes sp. RD1]